MILLERVGHHSYSSMATQPSSVSSAPSQHTLPWKSSLSQVTAVAWITQRPIPSLAQIHSCDPNESVIFVRLAFKVEYLEIYALVVEKATLSSTDHQSSFTSSGTPTLIPWDEWSAQGTRLIRECLPASLPAAVHGTRYAFVADTKNGLQTFQVYDFNTRRWPIHLNRDGEKGHDGDTANLIRVHSEESTIHSTGFTQPVRTSLPYHMVSTGPIFYWNQIVMDEDYIVGTQRKSGGGIRAEVLIM